MAHQERRQVYDLSFFVSIEISGLKGFHKMGDLSDNFKRKVITVSLVDYTSYSKAFSINAALSALLFLS